MAALQPKFKDKTQLKKLPGDSPDTSPEFDNMLRSSSYAVFRYPSDIEQSLNNVMFMVFNTVETVDQYSNASGAEPDLYYSLAGTNALTEVPMRNTTWTAASQQQKLDSAGGSETLQSVLEWTTRKYKRTNVGIVLPMPMGIRYNTNVGWQDVNAASVVGMLANISLNNKSITEKQISALKDVMTGLVHMGADTTLGDGMGQALTKSTQNSFQDQAFVGIQRREFEFSWTVAPTSPADLDNFINIIQLLRFQAHPSINNGKNESGNYLMFPGQVDVEWYTKDEGSGFIQNAWMPKIASCVITSIDTDYTPNNQFSYFRNAGAPTHYTLTLRLKETVPLTKIDVARGF